MLRRLVRSLVGRRRPKRGLAELVRMLQAEAEDRAIAAVGEGAEPEEVARRVAAARELAVREVLARRHLTEPALACFTRELAGSLG